MDYLLILPYSFWLQPQFLWLLSDVMSDWDWPTSSYLHNCLITCHRVSGVFDQVFQSRRKHALCLKLTVTTNWVYLSRANVCLARACWTAVCALPRLRSAPAAPKTFDNRQLQVLVRALDEAKFNEKISPPLNNHTGFIVLYFWKKKKV